MSAPGGGKEHPRPVAPGHALQDVAAQHRRTAPAAGPAGVYVLGCGGVNEYPAVSGALSQIHSVLMKQVGKDIMPHGPQVPGEDGAVVGRAAPVSWKWAFRVS